MPRYDLPTLLALSQNAHIDLDKFSDQAFDNNLVRLHRPCVGVLSEKKIKRSRKLSSFSHETGNTSSLEPQLSYPSRSPQDPPQSAIAQTNSGFARFLKEHTSPKHQRVTAGGRIVPMEPQSPVPKTRLPFNTGQSMILSHGEHESNMEGAHHPHATGASSATLDTLTASSAPMGVLPNMARLPLMQSTADQAHGVEMTAAIPNAGVHSGEFWQRFNPRVATGPSPSLQPEQQPSCPFPSIPSGMPVYGLGPEAVAYFSNPYSSLHTQNFYVSEQAPPLAQPATSSCPGVTLNVMSAKTVPYPSNFPSSLDTQSYIIPQWHPCAESQAMTSIQASMLQAPIEGTLHRTRLDEARKQHENLSAQLARIDRHTALHAWDIDPQSKKLLVEQRKSLVRELDVVRLYSDKLKELSEVPDMGPSNSQNNVAGEAITSIDNVHMQGNLAGSYLIPAPGPSYLGAAGAGQAHPPFSDAGFSSQICPANETPYHGLLWQNIRTADHHGKGCESSLLEHQDSGGPRHRKTTGRQMAAETLALRPLAPKESVPDEVSSNNQDWVTPVRPSRSDLRGLYHRISEATKQDDQGEMSQLLRELSLATSDLVQQKQKSTKAVRMKNNSDSSSDSQAGFNKAASDHFMQHEPPAKHSRKPWMSEIGVGAHNGNPSDPIFEPDGEDEDNTSMSYVSTTDSWATTLQDGRRQLIDKGSTRTTNNSRPWPRRQEPARKPLAPVMEQGAGHSGTARWCPTTANRSFGRHGGYAPVTEYRGARSVMTTGAPKHTHALFLAHGLNKDHSPVSQKSAALAVSQNVHALAFLPPFDSARSR